MTTALQTDTERDAAAAVGSRLERRVRPRPEVADLMKVLCELDPVLKLGAERCRDCGLTLAPGCAYYCTRCVLQHLPE